MSENRSTQDQRWGGPRERERCLREAERMLPTADAEDAVQEALFRAWRKQDAWVPPDGPLPWLLTITRNEARRLYSRSRPAQTVPVGEAPVGSADDPELERVALRVDVEHAVAALSEADRGLLELRYREDLTHRAVASRLGVPIGTVKVRLHRLRARLRVALEEGAPL